MITAAAFSTYTRKDLAQMAKEQGLTGWHSMRKDELVQALVKEARRNGVSPNGKPPKTLNGKAAISGKVSVNGKAETKANRPVKNGRAKAAPASTSGPETRRIQQTNAQSMRLKDLSGGISKEKENGKRRRDRVVLMVRDPYWLHASWEINRQSVTRAQTSLKEQWRASRPTLRLIEVEQDASTIDGETVVREIEIHGGVNDWYIDVHNPPCSYRIEIGYLAPDRQFYVLARSNTVTTPAPVNNGLPDSNWSDIADDYEKVYAMSGGYSGNNGTGDLQEMFEERLSRPMQPPMQQENLASSPNRGRDFSFSVDAELVIYGQTQPDARVTLAGEPVKLRDDGSFIMRQSLPDRRQVLPVVAGSGDGVEQRTIVLAIERNTKVMEPMIIDPNEV